MLVACLGLHRHTLSLAGNSREGKAGHPRQTSQLPGSLCGFPAEAGAFSRAVPVNFGGPVPSPQPTPRVAYLSPKLS